MQRALYVGLPHFLVTIQKLHHQLWNKLLILDSKLAHGPESWYDKILLLLHHTCGWLFVEVKHCDQVFGNRVNCSVSNVLLGIQHGHSVSNCDLVHIFCDAQKSVQGHHEIICSPGLGNILKEIKNSLIWNHYIL